MKTLKTVINEALNKTGLSIQQFVKMCANVCSGFQQAYFEQKAQDMDSIECVPLSDIFAKSEIKQIKQRVRPKQNECYSNAFHFCTQSGISGHELKYVEGYTTVAGIPIEHAWNKVDDKYIDITLELVLKKNVSEEDYVILGEWDADTALRYMAEKGTYGGVYEAQFMKKYNENPKK